MNSSVFSVKIFLVYKVCSSQELNYGSNTDQSDDLCASRKCTKVQNLLNRYAQSHLIDVLWFSPFLIIDRKSPSLCSSCVLWTGTWELSDWPLWVCSKCFFNYNYSVIFPMFEWRYKCISSRVHKFWNKIKLSICNLVFLDVGLHRDLWVCDISLAYTNTDKQNENS